MNKFEGKVAAITGAASGIGRALAVALAERGCQLAIADQDGSGLETTAEKVRARDAMCSSHIINVSDRAAVEQFVADVVEQHGGIHLVINNAGVTVVDSVESISYGDFEWLMGINFWGVVYGTKACLPYMLAAGEGHIVNISSLFGLMSAPMQGAYNASKFAVRGFTEALRVEMAGSPINISCVHPGGVKTNIVASARFNDDSVAMSQAELNEWFDAEAKTSAEEAAAIIIRGIEKNKVRILVGTDAKVADKIIRIFPTSYEERLGLAKEVRERMLKD